MSAQVEAYREVELNQDTIISPEKGAALNDPLMACILDVAKHFGMAAPASVFSTLALNPDGSLPFHQTEAALELLGLQSFPYAKKKLPQKDNELPAIISTVDGDAAVLYDLNDSEGLLWYPQKGEAVWYPIDDIAAGYAGRAVTAIPLGSSGHEDENHWDVKSRKHWFWQELAKMRPAFYPVLLGAFVINLLGFALPLFTMNVYDRVIPNKAVSSLWVLAIGVILAFLIEFMLRLARANLLDDIGRKLDLKLSQKLFAKVLNIPMAERVGSTGGMARRVSDYDIVRDFFASTTIVLIVDLLFMFLFVALIATLAGWLALVPVLMISIMIAAGFYLQRKITDTTLEAQANTGLQNALLIESISGVETLKSCASEGVMMGRWRQLAQMNSFSQEKLRKLNSTAVTLASLCQQGTSISLVIGGFYLFAAGTISMGAIIAIVMLAGRSLAPAGQFAFLITRGRQAFNTLESLQQMMEAGDERKAGGNNIVPTIRKGHVRFENLRFKYPESEQFALDGIDLEIKPGEKIAVIGRVTSGKSTLGRVMCGLYAPEEGALMIDDIDSRQYHPREIRSALRFVGQDSELFSGSIKDNLQLVAPGATDDELIEALQKVGADRYLSRDAGGFDRATGEKGAKLSGGQRSFLVLARALASDTKALFLDEPTGAMDIQTEKYFIERLTDAIRPDQTLVVSTHRHAIFQIVDRIVVMDSGKIVADGPRDQIMASIQAPAQKKGAA